MRRRSFNASTIKTHAPYWQRDKFVVGAVLLIHTRIGSELVEITSIATNGKKIRTKPFKSALAANEKTS